MEQPAVLDSSTLNHVGQLVTVHDIRGLGWLTEQPPPFQLRIIELCHDERKNLRGGVGRIEMDGHPLNGQWVIFAATGSGTWNFDTGPGEFIFGIYKHRPTYYEELATGLSLIREGRRSITTGFAIISKS